MGDVMRTFMARTVLFQEAVARAAGLNATDLQCANLLLLHGPATPGELAERAGLTVGGAITGAVDRLERAGLVRRVPDTRDRRRVLVVPDADQLHARVGELYLRVGQRWDDHLATLDDDQLTLAVSLFTRAAEITYEETGRLRDARARARGG
jgi:DNA-binding MarR family transcriptional regulator